MLRGKLGVLLSLLLLITLFVGATGWWYIRNLSQEIGGLYRENLQASTYLANAETGLWELRFALPNYLIGDDEMRQQIAASSEKYVRQVEDNVKLYSALPLSSSERDVLREWAEQFSAYIRARPHYFALVSAGKLDEAKEYRARETNPPAALAVRALVRLIDTQRQLGATRAERAEAEAVMASRVMLGLVVLAVFLSALLSASLAQHISDRVAEALRGVQRSSGELEGTAGQQANSARELASATSEISVTIRELLATSRQISDAARSVSNIADQTGASAKEGDSLVKRAQEALVAMRQRVDEIVMHMLNLGNKSQQIGSILEIINELAEQTNILSINATIEAAGAGEAGQRFAVVADEIRRLADRVGNSARDIRALVDEVRAAANTTVMATEDGSKAVAAGTQQFGEVLKTFEQIAHRVEETTVAARQIELSTKQQTGAVEQVNTAMAEVVRSAKETESSAQHTLKTCAELAQISKQLASLAGMQSTATSALLS